MTSPHDLADRYAQTQTRIASAASRCGRPVSSVSLVAVSKGQPAAAIRGLAALGQHHFGENYLQEAIPKMEQLRDLDLTWHFTGQLQANKTRLVASHFDWVHTVDRERTALRLNEQRSPHVSPINVCLQVSLEEETGKGGVISTEAEALALRIAELPRLRLRGLMALPPQRESFEEQLALFEQLAGLQQHLNSRGLALDTLSMGMSGDLEAAIAAGATMVRVGTAVFGERVKPAG